MRLNPNLHYAVFFKYAQLQKLHELTAGISVTLRTIRSDVVESQVRRIPLTFADGENADTINSETAAIIKATKDVIRFKDIDRTYGWDISNLNRRIWLEKLCKLLKMWLGYEKAYGSHMPLWKDGPLTDIKTEEHTLEYEHLLLCFYVWSAFQYGFVSTLFSRPPRLGADVWKCRMHRGD